MLVLTFTHISLALKEEFWIVPRSLITKESSSCTFINCNKLWSLFHFAVIKIKFGTCLSIIDYIEDLTYHFQFCSLSTITNSPVPYCTSLAFGLKKTIFNKFINWLFMSWLPDGFLELWYSFLCWVLFSISLKSFNWINCYLFFHSFFM